MWLVPLGEVAQIRPGLATSGRAAGAREGDWKLRVASVGDIVDDTLDVATLSVGSFERSWRVEEHLLRPDDLLVSARTTTFKAALVPPDLDRAVANATLLVVRPVDGLVDLAPYLWCFLTSPAGRRAVESRMVASTALRTLTATELVQLELPLPPQAALSRLAALVEASESAYRLELVTAHLRRQAVRDIVVQTAKGNGNLEAEVHDATN